MLFFAPPIMNKPSHIFLTPHLFLIASLASAVAQHAPSTQTPTIRTNSRIVIVDVVVTDSKGQPVHNLKASDFTLLEDKQSQRIRHFDEHIAIPTGPASSPEPKMAPNTFTNFISTPQGSALNIILLDALNTPQESQSFLRSRLKTLADALPSGSRIAIFGLSNSLVILQSFTSDPAFLKTIL